MPIDYARMSRSYPKQKARLTRATNSGDRAAVIRAVHAAVLEWDAIGAWPDGWHRWNNALQDAAGFGHYVDIDEMRDPDYVNDLLDYVQ